MERGLTADAQAVEKRSVEEVALDNANTLVEVFALKKLTYWFDYVAIGHPYAILQPCKSAFSEKFAQRVSGIPLPFGNVEDKKAAPVFARFLCGANLIAECRVPAPLG